MNEKIPGSLCCKVLSRCTLSFQHVEDSSSDTEAFEQELMEMQEELGVKEDIPEVYVIIIEFPLRLPLTYGAKLQ